ncbi:MAG: ATP-dependent RecD-like DNA helicase [Ardenticatenaceae bacterium]
MRHDDSPPLEEIEGMIERLTFHNRENGYTVGKFVPKGKREKVTIVGSMYGVNVGESLRLAGLWIKHREFGRQFEVKHYTVLLPASIEGIRTYLGSGLIKGVGPKMADSIVEHFGLDTLKIIDSEPLRLQEVAGIGQKRVKIIAQAWVEQRHIKQIMIFLQSHHITPTLAVKIYKQYGDTAIESVRRDPYRLAEDVFGVAFQTADRIAQRLGLPYDAPQRVRAGIVFASRQFVKEGHVFTMRQELISSASKLIGVDLEQCEEQLNLLLKVEKVEKEVPEGEKGAQEERVASTEKSQDGQDLTSPPEAPVLVTDEQKQRIYLPAFYYAEIAIAQQIERLLKTPWDRLGFYRTANWPAVFEWLDKHNPFLLSDNQKEAVALALTKHVAILTGGPGTGKSTITSIIIQLLKAKSKSVLLAAPTGRAAKRLSETTGQAAQTIHRLLEWNPSGKEGFIRNQDHPLDADMVIVDEASMIDTLLMNHLLKAIKEGTHLLFVGDVDQLPCVGAGNVLRDMIASERIPTVVLDTIYRQEQDSYIITNAHRINQGQMPIFLRDAHDFYFFGEQNPHEAALLLIDIVSRRLPDYFGWNPERDIQVLTPMHRGAVGVIALNEALQQTLNPPASRKVEVPHGDRMMREGDRVMQIRNNYEKEIFNGDLGYIYEIDLEEQQVLANFDSQIVEYEFHELDQLVHAYAISVHKSQGCEYPVVVIPLLNEHYSMLQRNLLYTAITRAKKKVIIVGTKGAIRRAVHNARVTARNTSLAERLRKGD